MRYRSTTVRLNGLSDLLLYREDITTIAVVSMGPEVIAIRGLVELHRNPQFILFLTNASLQHPAMVFYQLRRHCKSAVGTAYVTSAALQKRYPCPGHMAAISDVDLSLCPVLPAARRFVPAAEETGRKTVITVGSLDHLYKGQDTLIQAIADC